MSSCHEKSSAQFAGIFDLPVQRDGKPCYTIHIRDDFRDLPMLCARQQLEKKALRACIVSDSKVAELYLTKIETLLSPVYDTVISFVFPAGEASKTLDTVQDLYETLIRSRFDRNDLLIALGGGVTGDLCGYAASSYMRGIDFIQVPTTLLSQVDSSIGGKTGVDFRGFKNMVGAFYMPRLVYINVSVLQTLPADQLLSGMGEVLKHGLIQDNAYFEQLASDREKILSLDPQALMSAVYGSCRIKRRVTEEDPFEHGIRATLNFGHTIGHAIESLSEFALPHGQCVALGMRCALQLSVQKCGLSEIDARRAASVLDAYGFPEVLPKSVTVRVSPEDVLRATYADKKRSGMNLKFVVLSQIGRSDVMTGFTDEELLGSIRSLYPARVGSEGDETA